MKTIGVATLMVFMHWLGAYSHEGDIQRQCAKNGSSGAAAWRGELVCSPKVKP